MSRVTYQCTALAGSNKAGVLRPDANGYYELVLGAFNVLNSAGEFYVLEPVKRLFESSSDLMRRVRNGALRSEMGHPKNQPGLTQKDFFMRILRIEEQCVCAHIKQLDLDFDTVKDQNGNPIVTVIGRVAPSGPFGDVLARQLGNPDENVCFSIRSFVDAVPGRNGIINKIVKEIVTYDYVNEPGISVANKYQAPSLESYSQHTFGSGHILAAKEALTSLSTGFEDETVTGVNRVIEVFGIEDIAHEVKRQKLPPSMTW